jgi:multidrug efflux pump
MVVLMVLGFAYFQLGQDEDPPFTFRAMVVRTFWPGATAQQVAEQVTDKIERTLQEVPYADKIRSYSKPGESLIIFQIKDSSRPATSPTSGTRCARRSATCATRCRPACRARSSTTNSATSTA